MHRLPVLLLLGLALCTATACPTTTGGGDSTWADGTLSRVYNASHSDTHKAALKALRDFGFSLYRNNPEEIEAFNRGGKRIQVNLVYLSPHAVAVSVHVGRSGNRRLSTLILGQIGVYLAGDE